MKKLSVGEKQLKGFLAGITAGIEKQMKVFNSGVDAGISLGVEAMDKHIKKNCQGCLCGGRKEPRHF